MKQKIHSDIDAIVADVPDGARIMFGGFGGAGFPNNLIQALERKGTKDIIAISNNCGTGEGELGLLFKHDRIRHVIASFPGPHATYFQQRFAAKQVSLELVPQGSGIGNELLALRGAAGWFEQWADATWATDPVGAKQNPPVLRAPNGVIADFNAYWIAGKSPPTLVRWRPRPTPLVPP